MYTALRRLLAAALFLALTVLCGLPTQAQEPALTIVLSGNTYGNYEPCPSWGGKLVGGLARRAAFIESLRSAAPGKDRTLVIAAPFEILSDGPEKKPEPRRLPAISQAMTRLGYDAGAILPSEAAYLQSADAPLPSGFTVLGDKPATAVIDKGGVKVGIVFFPAPADLTKPTPPAVGDAVAETAKKLRPSVSLVIGVSGIGMIDEEAFLAAHPGVLDVLLGSGLNAGTAGRPGPGGKTLFARAYTRGKTVNRLDLYQLPGSPDFAWKPNENFKAEVVNLDEAYPADPEIKKLFE